MIIYVEGFEYPEDEQPRIALTAWRAALYSSQRDTLAVFPDCEEQELQFLFTISLDAIERTLAKGAISAIEAEQLRTEVFDAFDALQPPGTPSSRGLTGHSIN